VQQRSRRLHGRRERAPPCARTRAEEGGGYSVQRLRPSRRDAPPPPVPKVGPARSRRRRGRVPARRARRAAAPGVRRAWLGDGRAGVGYAAGAAPQALDARRRDELACARATLPRRQPGARGAGARRQVERRASRGSGPRGGRARSVHRGPDRGSSRSGPRAPRSYASLRPPREGRPSWGADRALAERPRHTGVHAGDERVRAEPGGSDSEGATGTSGVGGSRPPPRQNSSSRAAAALAEKPGSRFTPRTSVDAFERISSIRRTLSWA